ncbi:hypothetical protein KCU89_g44, partial [Aureobasidium melanogenum]
MPNEAVSSTQKTELLFALHKSVDQWLSRHDEDGLTTAYWLGRHSSITAWCRWMRSTTRLEKADLRSSHHFRVHGICAEGAISFRNRLTLSLAAATFANESLPVVYGSMIG